MRDSLRVCPEVREAIVKSEDRTFLYDVFLKVAESRSFSAAAEVFNLTPSGVNRMMTREESRLRVRLFERSTKCLQLTSEGQLYSRRVSDLLQAMRQAEEELADMAQGGTGALRVSCATSFLKHQILPILADFRAHSPGVRLDFSVSDHVCNLLDDRIDLAIRVGNIRQESLHARYLAESSMMLVAAPAYLDRHGVPEVPDDLQSHFSIGMSFLEALNEWPFLYPDQNELCKHHIDPSITANSGELALEMALAGMGITRLAAFHAASAVQNGDLVELLR